MEFRLSFPPFYAAQTYFMFTTDTQACSVQHMPALIHYYKEYTKYGLEQKTFPKHLLTVINTHQHLSLNVLQSLQFLKPREWFMLASL